MAEVLTAHGWPEPGSVSAILAEALPDDYFVVERPTVQGRPLDAVVFGPRGLVVLHVRDWAGEIEPARHGDWHVRLPSGERVGRANPARDAGEAEAALRAFFRDEFPDAVPAIHQMLVLTDPGAAVVGETPPGLPAVMLAGLAGAIESLAAPPTGALPDPAQRERLAVALRERRLTVSQRAAQPFVFRSGGTFGSGKKVWSVRQAVAHMDAHPEDGVYHLQNDTLARWFEEQGAPHLATLAREALRGRESDPRAAVERFLIGTGLVRRPALEVRPWPVNLGCVVAGEESSARIRVRKGRGRGYLFGRVSSSAAWVRVEPHEFSGRPLVATVIADSAGLPIRQAPSQAELLVESSASEAPVAVPVRLRVTGQPAAFDRNFWRPLAGLLVAGAIGAAIGWALGGPAGTPVPALAARLGVPAVPPALFWAALVGVGWAISGLIRGARQRLAWPVRYATGRFLLFTALWAVLLGLGAAAGLWLWNRISGQPGPPVVSPAGLRVVLGAAAFAVVPAVIGEVRAARLSRDTPLGTNRGLLLRPVAAVAIGLAALILAGVAVRFGGPTWRGWVAAGRVEAVQDRATGWWRSAEERLYGAVDRYYLERYDRRATPQPTPTPSAAPTSAAPSGGE